MSSSEQRFLARIPRTHKGSDQICKSVNVCSTLAFSTEGNKDKANQSFMPALVAIIVTGKNT